MLYLHTNYEKVPLTLSEDKHEFHLVLSLEISLLDDSLDPVCFCVFFTKRYKPVSGAIVL